MMRALIRSALRLVITFSVAAGMRMSQSETMSSSLGMASAPRKPSVVPLRYLYSTELVDVDAVGIVEAAVLLGDADDLVAVLHHEAGGVGADVAEALNDDAAAVDGQVEIAQALVADHHDAAAGGLDAAARAADVERLAGDDAGDGVAHVHGVGVHDPGHGLLVGVDVGRGNVFFRSDEVDDLGGVAAGHALQLALAHASWGRR